MSGEWNNLMIELKWTECLKKWANGKNEWINEWMNEQILERWQNWMLYSWRKAHLFILDSIKQSESGNKKCKNRSFLVILTPRCVAICAVTWSFPFIWPTCDSRTYHWFNSKGPKKFSRSCICPTDQDERDARAVVRDARAAVSVDRHARVLSNCPGLPSKDCM